jgi:hypothetical protein
MLEKERILNAVNGYKNSKLSSNAFEHLNVLGEQNIMLLDQTGAFGEAKIPPPPPIR